MIVELSPLKFSDRTFYILSNERQCDVWIEAVVFTHLIKVTWRKFHCRQISGFTSPPTSGLGTPLIRRGEGNFPRGNWYPSAYYGTGWDNPMMGGVYSRWSGKHTLIYKGRGGMGRAWAAHYMGEESTKLGYIGRCTPPRFPHHGKPWNTHQGSPGTKILRLNMCRFITLSKLAHQMWHNHPFS